jgi:hypothetical protein
MTKTNQLFIKLLDKQIEYLQAARDALSSAEEVANQLSEAMYKAGKEANPRSKAWGRRKKDGVV